MKSIGSRAEALPPSRWRAHAPCALGAYTWRSASYLRGQHAVRENARRVHTPLSRRESRREALHVHAARVAAHQTVCAPVATSPAHHVTRTLVGRSAIRARRLAHFRQPARGEEAEAASAARDDMGAAQRTSDAAGDATTILPVFCPDCSVRKASSA